MPQSCVCYGCTNRRRRGSGIAFHKFPFQDDVLLAKWKAKISREKFQPSIHQTVCSEHFRKQDYANGIHPSEKCEDVSKSTLLPAAVPSIFPQLPSGKKFKPRAPSTFDYKRHLTGDESSSSQPPSKKLHTDHTYHCIEKLKDNLNTPGRKSDNAQKELKATPKVPPPKKEKISKMLQKAKDKKLISLGQYDLLKMNFGETTCLLVENETGNLHKAKTTPMYSEDLKKFAIALHSYSAKAYNFIRKHVQLPPPNSLYELCASTDCHPGFLTQVITHLGEQVQKEENMRHCILALDAMAIKKEAVYDPQLMTYAGFVDWGNFQPMDEDGLATRGLVVMAVGLTGHWKFPVAYFLVDHLSVNIQAEIIKHLICALTDVGMKVHGVCCDGSSTSQAIALRLGCFLDPAPVTLMSHFQHPQDPSTDIHFIFDAGHLIKLVTNCLATLGIIYHDGHRISWEYIFRLQKCLEKDVLNLTNKPRAKHIMWQQHKMNVKSTDQVLSAPIADAIDFLRLGLYIRDFRGSGPTTDFIRRMGELLEFLTTKNNAAEGNNKPFDAVNCKSRQVWLLDMKRYIKNLNDRTGQPLCRGKTKTAWTGLMATMDSVLHITRGLFIGPEPVKYVLTYTMSLEHLEMFFSRIRRRAECSTPNCLQFKSALENSVMPPEKAIEEPVNRLFGQTPSAAALHNNRDVQKFAELLSKPSEYHDYALQYMAGYITQSLLGKCKCTQCCVALHENAIGLPQTPVSRNSNSQTSRKDCSGLVQPRADVFIIVKRAHKVLRTTRCALPDQSKVPHAVVQDVQHRVITDTRSVVFRELETHFYNQCLSDEDDHCFQLTKQITNMFFDIMMPVAY